MKCILNFHIRGNLINGIKDFLKGREQRVVVNNEFSDLESVVSDIHSPRQCAGSNSLHYFY